MLKRLICQSPIRLISSSYVPRRRPLRSNFFHLPPLHLVRMPRAFVQRRRHRMLLRRTQGVFSLRHPYWDFDYHAGHINSVPTKTNSPSTIANA
jgi:hypothetical protein